VPINITKRQADRLRVLHAIFDAADGVEREMVRLAPTIQTQLRLSDQELLAHPQAPASQCAHVFAMREGADRSENTIGDRGCAASG
jgi:hypothetical protein